MSRVLRSTIAACILLFASLVAKPQTSGPVQYVYDNLGRLVAVIDASGNAAVYSYDAVGNILSIARYAPTQVAVISFTPGQGSEGTPVTIYGTGFNATNSQNTVQFNGVAAVVTSATSNQLITTVPPSATTGPIVVTTPQGTAVSTTPFVVGQASAVPTITSITPTVALANSVVTIGGTNFNTTPVNDHVRFNNIASAIAMSATPTAITATVPSGTGSGRIAVSTPGGLAVSPTDLFIPFNSHVVGDVAYTARTTIGASQNVSFAANKIAILLFDAANGQRVGVLLNRSTFTSSTLYLLRPDGTVLAQGATSISDTLLPMAGTYAIGIESTSGGSAGVQLMTDATGTIVIDGPPVTAATTTAGQDARLTFAATAGQQVVLSVTNVTNPSATINLLGAAGEPQGSPLSIANTPSGNLFFMDQQTLPVTGTYTLWVQHAGSNIGTETLQLNSAQDFIAPITLGGPPVRVPSTGDTIIGQNGRLTFTGVAGHRVSMTVSSSTYSGGACFLSLVDPTGTVVTSGWACYGSTNVFVDSTTLNTSGLYTVLVNPVARATGHASVQLYDASDVTGTISIDGPAVTATTTVQGQDARYTFSATAGQRIVASVTSVTNPLATVVLLKPDGTTQTSFSINNNPAGQFFFMDTQTLATAGTYTLWVQHNGTNTGSETLQLHSVPADYTATLTPGIAALVPPSGNLAAGQNASLTFNANAGSEASIQFSNSTMGLTSVSLLNPDGTTRSTITSSSAAFTLTAMLPSTGTYTVFINPAAASSGSVSVLLTIAGSARIPTRAPGSLINPGNALSQNIVGLFLMNEGTGTTDTNIVDGQTAAFSGTTTPVWNTGDPSVAFSGTTTSLSSYLDAGTDLSFDQLPTNKMTVVAKVFLNSVATGGIAEKSDDFGSGFIFGLDSTGALTAYVFKSSNPMQVSTGAGALTSGQWVQVAFTWDGTVGTAAAAHIYVNGIEQTKAVAQDGIGTLSYATATNKSFRIANGSWGKVGSLNGKIAYVAVYKYRVLTATELNQLDAQLPITTDVVGTTTENGASTTVTTTTAGQNAHVRFQGWSNQQVAVQLSNNSMGSIAVNLVAPDGTTVATTTSSAGSFALSTTTLPLTGTYDVFAQGPATVGSITVSVVTTTGGRGNGSVIDSSNPLSSNNVGLFLMNEGTGTTDTNIVDGQTAAFSGTTAPVWNTSDPSVAFNGTTTSLSSYLDAGTDLNFDQLPTSKITVVAKVFVNSVATGGIAEKTDDSSSGFVFGLNSTGALTAYVLKTSNPMQVSTGAGAVISGQWVQLAFTWDGTVGTAAAAHIYVNGVEQTKAVAQDGIGTLSYVNATNKAFRIANGSWGLIGSLNGKIAYVAVYRGRILSSTELNQLDIQLPIK